jgi:hypothetical protein
MIDSNLLSYRKFNSNQGIILISESKDILPYCILISFAYCQDYQLIVLIEVVKG